MNRLRNVLNRKIKTSVSSKSFGWFYEKGGEDKKKATSAVFRWNSLFVYGVFITVGVLFLSRLGFVQILHGSIYLQRSETNRTEKIRIRAPRGVIYDRNDLQLTNNAPSYRLMLDANELEEDTDISELSTNLSSILDTEKEVVGRRIREKLDEGQDKILIERELSKDQFLLVNASQGSFPGIYVEEDVKRVYPYEGYLSHILGYTGEVNQEDVKESERYSSGDVIGKIGLEYQYEDLLKGEDGQRNVVIDVSGSVVSEQSIVKPIRGNNLRLSLDLEAQRFLQDVLAKGVEDSGATGAAALVADINTGEIVSAVSLPSYDNNLFVGGIGEKEYSSLLNDSDKPLLNRFIGAAQPPGSTFKTITAIAGLDSDAINTNTIYNSTGVFYLGNYPFQEYHRKSYGPINVIQALSKSSNIFFYETVLEMGIDNLSDYSDRFGLSKNTGIDIPGEIVGNYSSPEYKALLTDERWYPGDSLNAAIGQGYSRVTPVQMLRWISAIGNGGVLITPHFVTEYQDETDVWIKSQYEGVKMDVDPSVLEIVRTGMRESVASGVAYTLRNAKVEVAAKTGTAEFGIKDEDGEYTKTHAWITGFFPYDEPQYAFVFFQEAGGLGSDSGKVANEFINWFANYEDSL